MQGAELAGTARIGKTSKEVRTAFRLGKEASVARANQIRRSAMYVNSKSDMQVCYVCEEQIRYAGLLCM